MKKLGRKAIDVTQNKDKIGDNKNTKGKKDTKGKESGSNGSQGEGCKPKKIKISNSLTLDLDVKEPDADGKCPKGYILCKCGEGEDKPEEPSGDLEEGQLYGEPCEQNFGLDFYKLYPQYEAKTGKMICNSTPVMKRDANSSGQYFIVTGQVRIDGYDKEPYTRNGDCPREYNTSYIMRFSVGVGCPTVNGGAGNQQEIRCRAPGGLDPKSCFRMVPIGGGDDNGKPDPDKPEEPKKLFLYGMVFYELKTSSEIIADEFQQTSRQPTGEFGSSTITITTDFQEPIDNGDSWGIKFQQTYSLVTSGSEGVDPINVQDSSASGENGFAEYLRVEKRPNLNPNRNQSTASSNYSKNGNYSPAFSFVILKDLSERDEAFPDGTAKEVQTIGRTTITRKWELLGEVGGGSCCFKCCDIAAIVVAKLIGSDKKGIEGEGQTIKKARTITQS